jgi:hypothetical protein
MNAEWDKFQAQIDAENEKKKLISLAKIAEANRVLFARECEQAGIDPALGTSPSLLKLLRQRSI